MDLPGPHSDLPKFLASNMCIARVVINKNILPAPHILVPLPSNSVQASFVDVLNEIQRHIKEVILDGVLLVGVLFLFNLRVLFGICLVLLHYLLNLLAEFVVIQLCYVLVLHLLWGHSILPPVEYMSVQSGLQCPSVKVGHDHLSLEAQISRGLLGQPSIPSLQLLLLLFLVIRLSVSLFAHVRLHLGLNVLL